MKKGFFISFEGVEGSGKTTQVKLLGRALSEKGHHCITTREPGGTVIGNRVRSLLLHPENDSLDPLAELLLYEACRAQLVGEVILPEIERGSVVLCDRFTDSTFAYQAKARGLNRDLVYQLNHIAASGFVPDKTIFLDLDPKEGLRRARGRNTVSQGINDESRFENEALDFHSRVREGFLEIAEREPDRVKVISAEESILEIQEKILLEIDSWLPGI
ncbi:MAG: dTMP kinase [Nitrospinota bacterium]